MKKSGRRMANCYQKGRPNDAVPIGLGFASFYRVGFPSTRSVRVGRCQTWIEEPKNEEPKPYDWGMQKDKKNKNSAFFL